MSAPGNVYSRKVFRAKASDSSGDLIYLPLALKNYLPNPSTNVTSEKKDDSGFKQKFFVDYVRHYDYVDASNNLIHCCSGFLLDPSTNSNYATLIAQDASIQINYLLHNLDGSNGTKNRKGKIRITDSSGYKYFILNDGGLNTKPFVRLTEDFENNIQDGVEAITTTLANIIVDYKNAYYIPTTKYYAYFNLKNKDSSIKVEMKNIQKTAGTSANQVHFVVRFEDDYPAFQHDISVGDIMQFMVSAQNSEGIFYFPFDSYGDSSWAEYLVMDGTESYIWPLILVPDASISGSTTGRTYYAIVTEDMFELSGMPDGKYHTFGDLFSTTDFLYQMPNPSVSGESAPSMDQARLYNAVSDQGEKDVLPEGYYYGMGREYAPEADPASPVYIYVDGDGYAKKWSGYLNNPTPPPGPTPSVYANIASVTFLYDYPPYASYTRTDDIWEGLVEYFTVYFNPQITIVGITSGPVVINIMLSFVPGQNADYNTMSTPDSQTQAQINLSYNGETITVGTGSGSNSFDTLTIDNIPVEAKDDEGAYIGFKILSINQRGEGEFTQDCSVYYDGDLYEDRLNEDGFIEFQSMDILQHAYEREGGGGVNPK